MNLRLAVFALFAALCASPAFSQTVMLNYSWPEMRQALVGAGATITAEGADGDIRYFDAKSKDDLMFTVFGFECDTKETTQRCRGAQLAASFTPKDSDSLAKALDAIDYAAVADNASARGNVRLTRYVIFDEGITPGNLKSNITVFLNISNDIWEMLGDKGWLK